MSTASPGIGRPLVTGCRNDLQEPRLTPAAGYLLSGPDRLGVEDRRRGQGLAAGQHADTLAQLSCIVAEQPSACHLLAR